jgi:predicted DNA repair protein MutK
MVLLEFIYDARNEKYPIYHSGILVFVIIIFIPLNLGLSRLPPAATFLLLIAGFTSLFMLVRNEKVGLAFLNHLRVTKQKKALQTELVGLESSVYEKNKSKEYGGSKQASFILLQNIVERITIASDEHLDLETRLRLENTRKSLQKITRQLCKLDA